MGEMNTNPEDGSWGIVSSTCKDPSETAAAATVSSTIANVYWTIAFTENAVRLEESRRGTYFSSQTFSIRHPSDPTQSTYWKLRLYPYGDINNERGVSLYVEPRSDDFGIMKFSAVPLQMGGGEIESLKGSFEQDKYLSSDGRALGFCLGGFRQVLESVKRRNSKPNNVLYITFPLQFHLD